MQNYHTFEIIRLQQLPRNFFFRPKLTPVEKERPTVIKFPSHSDLSGVALRLDEVSFHYNKGTTIFQNVDISACYDSRICIVSCSGL